MFSLSLRQNLKLPIKIPQSTFFKFGGTTSPINRFSKIKSFNLCFREEIPGKLDKIYNKNERRHFDRGYRKETKHYVLP